jgi:hypothetical protein
MFSTPPVSHDNWKGFLFCVITLIRVSFDWYSGDRGREIVKHCLNRFEWEWIILVRGLLAEWDKIGSNLRRYSDEAYYYPTNMTLHLQILSFIIQGNSKRR